ncbi:putative serine/threonine-protein kinase WNK11 [Artemisia annua]|uniref:non-specific serine/threonine protein kinase n=1 Tax=Artemisia annua TaxID=35608 RepID=A0A2U1PSX8_ARTAN|nr:putative serine/threonine-protein kinase WNK11 [Artemisia annua]
MKVNEEGGAMWDIFKRQDVDTIEEYLSNHVVKLVWLQSLNLVICPKLNVLKIEPPIMALHELKGCGVLSQALVTGRVVKIGSQVGGKIKFMKGDCLNVVIKKWARHILEGFKYMHTYELCVIHIDLNCSNIFINGNTLKVP